MRAYNTFSFVLFLGFLITFLFSCTKEEKLEFGPVQTGFVEDSVYQALTDGFLSVQITANYNSSDLVARIISDTNPEPTTEIGVVGKPGVTTLPIRKNNYWKVVVQTGTAVPGATINLNISWTPLE